MAKPKTNGNSKAASPTKNPPKVTPEARERMRQRAIEQWKDPSSKLRNRQLQGKNENRRKPPKNAVEIIEYAVSKYGSTKEQLAQALGVSPWLFDQWLIRHSEIREAFERSKGIEHSKLIGVLFEQAMAGNTTAAIVLLKFRHGMRDSGPIPGSDDSPEIRAAKLRAALKAIKEVDGLDGVDRTAGLTTVYD